MCKDQKHPRIAVPATTHRPSDDEEKDVLAENHIKDERFPDDEEEVSWDDVKANIVASYGVVRGTLSRMNEKKVRTAIETPVEKVAEAAGATVRGVISIGFGIIAAGIKGGGSGLLRKKSKKTR